jgi:hypothetical protein
MNLPWHAEGRVGWSISVEAARHGCRPSVGTIRDLTVSVFERSGHTPQVDEAVAFDERVLGWLGTR